VTALAPGPLQWQREASLPATDAQQQEIELARRLVAGEPGAFERFVELFRNKLFQYSLLVCGHHEDAEEVAQDALFKVFEKLDQLREPERIRPWVFRIARNACLMKRRKSVFAPERELSLEELMPQAGEDGGQWKLEIADWSSLPEDQALRAELQRVVREAIQALPEIYKTVLLLRDIEGLSTAETAEVLGVSEEVVKTRLHRARLAVRQKLDSYLRSSRGNSSRGKAN
jgi:RNA polymerase sigma-70 factor (ECF subfamily)